MGTQLVLRSWSSNEQLPDLYPIRGLPRPNMGALDSCRGCCFSFRDGNTTGVPQLPVGSLIPSDNLPTSLGSVLPWRVASTALIQIPYGPGLPPAVLSRLCPLVHLPWLMYIQWVVPDCLATGTNSPLGNPATSPSSTPSLMCSNPSPGN